MVGIVVMFSGSPLVVTKSAEQHKEAWMPWGSGGVVTIMGQSQAQTWGNATAIVFGKHADLASTTVINALDTKM